MLLLCCTAVLLGEAAAGLQWTPPAGWTAKGPAPMRAATYEIGDAECVVYFFGPGQGGTVEANLARWNGQFTLNDKPATGKTVKKTVHGLNVTTLDVAGTYVATGGMAATPQAPKPETRMLAAIVEGPGGSIFVKFSGPAKTVGANSAKFDSLIASFRKE
jgi:hypothetical protein